MPVFVYKGLDHARNAVEGIIEASTAKEARLSLLERNIVLLDIKPASGEEDDKGRIYKGGKASALSLLTRQFATLTRAGIPIAEALDALINVSENPKMQIVLRDIKENVLQGMSLADAMAKHPKIFGTFYVNMVRVGEATGNMDNVLMRLSEYLHTQAKLSTKVKNALIYPVLLLTVGILVVGFLITFIVPRITDVLIESGKTLPAPTIILISISSFLSRFWWAVLLGVAGIYVLYKAVVSTEGGKLARDAFLLSLPVVGNLIKKSIVARFCLSFAALLKSGLPAVESLEVVKFTARNKLLENAIIEIRERLIEGQDISSIVKRSEIFPPLVGYMIAVGEESGRLEEMLEIINEYFEEEIEAATTRFTSVLQPLMIIILAFIVGFVVLAVILPIMELGEIV